MIGQALQHVADIDYHAMRGRIDRQPFTVSVLHLQARFLGAEQQGNDVNVFVGASPHPDGTRRHGRVVQNPQHTITELHFV